MGSSMIQVYLLQGCDLTKVKHPDKWVVGLGDKAQ